MMMINEFGTFGGYNDMIITVINVNIIILYDL